MACMLVSVSGWILQFVLGILAFAVLLLKRQGEVPRRSWKIWFFDTSKQGFVAIEIHFINVGIARVMMERMDNHDSCTWYFTMVLLDSTFGLLTVYYLLKWSAYLVSRHRIRILYSGDYGIPPQYKPWFCVYNLIMLVEKALVSCLFLIPFVQKAGAAILQPIGRVSPTFELVLAIVITPFLINVMWFWIVDNFLMKVEKQSFERGADAFSLQDELAKKKFDRETRHAASPAATGVGVARMEMAAFQRLLDDDDSDVELDTQA